MLVHRAVERADARVRYTTTGLHLTVEEDGVDVLVLAVAALEDAVPEALDAVDVPDDAAVLPRVDVLDVRALVGDFGGRVAPADRLVVERAELPQTAAAAREQRDQQVDRRGRRDPARRRRRRRLRARPSCAPVDRLPGRCRALRHGESARAYPGLRDLSRNRWGGRPRVSARSGTSLFSGETTRPSAVEGPVATIQRIEDEHPAWMSFPGFCDELQYFHGPGPFGTVPFRTSPQGPVYPRRLDGSARNARDPAPWADGDRRPLCGGGPTIRRSGPNRAATIGAPRQ